MTDTLNWPSVRYTKIPWVIHVPLRAAAMILLVTFDPVICGCYWYTHFNESLVSWLRNDALHLLVIAFTAIWLGGRKLGYFAAPLVLLVSGVWYAFVERGYRGTRDFEENVFAAVLFAVVFGGVAVISVLIVGKVYSNRMNHGSHQTDR